MQSHTGGVVYMAVLLRLSHQDVYTNKKLVRNKLLMCHMRGIKRDRWPLPFRLDFLQKKEEKKRGRMNESVEGNAAHLLAK